VRLLAGRESTYLPIGVKYRLENPGKVSLHLIEVQSGGYLGEDDIVRFDDRGPVVANAGLETAIARDTMSDLLREAAPCYERAVPAAQPACAMLDAASVPDAARAAAAGELRQAREIRHLVVEESERRLA